MKNNDYVDGIEYLREVDPKLNWIVKNIEIKKNRPRAANFEGLVKIIVGQQLSGAAADTIFNRLKSSSSNDELSVQDVLSISSKEMQWIGISKAKLRYIQNLARYVEEKPNYIGDMRKLPAEQAISELTKLNGIGTWTASIFTMFYLGHKNVFANADTSIEKAIISIYGEDHSCGSEKWFNLLRKWEPFKTVACMILWSWVDAKMPQIID